MTVLFWLSFIAIGYAYLGYPVILFLCKPFCNRRGEQSASPGELPVISIVVACHNESGVIEKKVKNCLELLNDYPKGSEGKVVIASDGSSDDTANRCRALPDPRIVVVESPARIGKEGAQRLALQHTVGSLIVFTDAKAELRADALRGIARTFEVHDVGGVSSIDKVVGDGGGEGFYVRYEMWMRRLESDVLSLVGMSGSAFAVRQELCSELRDDVPSDFSLLLAMRKRGLRGVLAEDFPCFYQSALSPEQEFNRKVRTALRGITTLWKLREVLDARQYGLFSWQVWSHKVMRWLVPMFLVLLYGALAKIAPGSIFYSILFLGAGVFVIAALLGFFKPSLRENLLVKIALFFFVANAAIAVAWAKFFLGQQVTQWRPTQRPLSS